MVVASKALPGILADERLGPMLRSMSKVYVGRDFTQPVGDEIQVKDINTVGVWSCVPCIGVTTQDSIVGVHEVRRMR